MSRRLSEKLGGFSSSRHKAAGRHSNQVSPGAVLRDKLHTPHIADRIRKSASLLGAKSSAVQDASRRARKHVSSYTSAENLAGAKRHPAKQSILAVIVVAALAILVLLLIGIFVIWPMLSAPSTPNSVEPSRVVDTNSQSVSYNGFNYTLVEKSGHYQLCRTSAGSSDPLVLMELQGKPAALILFDGALLVPENLDGSWDVIAYTMGDGSEATQVRGKDGQPFAGQGSIQSAELSGNNLRLTLSDASVKEISLV